MNSLCGFIQNQLQQEYNKTLIIFPGPNYQNQLVDNQGLFTPVFAFYFWFYFYYNIYGCLSKIGNCLISHK